MGLKELIKFNEVKKTRKAPKRKKKKKKRKKEIKLSPGYKGKILCVKIITLTFLMWQEVGNKT